MAAVGPAETYLRTRRALVASTGVALAVYLLLPVAPPRMLPGFVDTAAVHGQSVYGDAGASALANQYAALPSLHVGWAVLVALACITAGRSRWRWLWLAHPVVTVGVVVVTANHFWLDAAAGAALVALAWHASGLVHRRRTTACAADGSPPDRDPAERLDGADVEDGPVDELLQVWSRAVGAHGSAETQGRALLSRYDERQRRYHDRRHLAEVLKALEVLSPDADVPSTVVLAALFHDAVYQPTAADNEERSAVLAEQVLVELGRPRSEVDEVVRLVRLTATHDAADDDTAGALLDDADLAVLGAPPERYREYAADVRSEYDHLSDEAFTTGRAAVLRELAERPRLFRTERAHRRWDDQARQNLQGELSRLGAAQPL